MINMPRSLASIPSGTRPNNPGEKFKYSRQSVEVPPRNPATPPVLFCFSHLRWSFVFQRPQHLLARALRDYRVFFVEEPIWEDIPHPELRLDQRSEGVTVAVPVLPLGMRDEEGIRDILRDLVDQLMADTPARETVLWYYTPMAMGFTDHLSADVVVYDGMDELSAFRGASPLLRDCEQQLFKCSDVVFTGGMRLYEAKRKQHKNVHPFPSSVDANHFLTARNRKMGEPLDQAGIPYPRVGFFGVIDERMDLDLVAQLAALRPDLQLVFIGPVVKIDQSPLPQAENIHCLGIKDYKELPRYLAGWDVAFMPFAMNESTRFISPTKTPEFLAAGVPVVSTPVADVVNPYGVERLVEIAATAEEASLAISVLLERQRERWLAQVDQRLASMSWDKTWGDMNKLILARLRAAMSLQRSRSIAREVSARV